MPDENKAREQLIQELAALRQRVAEIENVHKQTGERLRASEERFRSIAQTASDAVISIDNAGNVIFWNKAAEVIFGYPADEMAGRPLTSIMPERFREAHKEGRKHAASTGEFKLIGKVIEIIGLRKDNSEFPIELSLGASPTTEGIFFTGIIRDITKRKQMEEALRESEGLYRQLAEQPFDGVFVRSQDKILFMNKAGARILGAEDPSQFVGKSMLDFLHPDYHEFVRKRVQEVYETGKFVPLVEEKFIRFDGKVIDAEVAATAFTYGGAPAVQVIFRDITEHKRIEEEREKLVDELQKTLSEVKTLKGILPICASCKKIRDDQGYWNQVESYVRDHSEAEFTHGICPECREKLYPDFPQKIK